jgi:hypothetical protein
MIQEIAVAIVVVVVVVVPIGASYSCDYVSNCVLLQLLAVAC